MPRHPPKKPTRKETPPTPKNINKKSSYCPRLKPLLGLNASLRDERVVRDMIWLILSTPSMVLVRDSGVLSSTEAWIELSAQTRTGYLEFMKS